MTKWLVDEVIKGTLGLPFGTDLSEEDSMGTLPGWDSYGHLSLMLAIEAFCNTKIGVDDWRELRTVGALRRRFGGTSEENAS